MDFIAEGINRQIITFDSEEKIITYNLKDAKKRRYTDPEEKVQAVIFCRLVLEYGYSAKRITINETVTMGASRKEADIIVYNDDALTQPYIVVECKTEDISDAEFKQAINQAFAYSHALAGTTKFIWVTKGDKDEYYKFDKDTNKKEEEADIPHFGQTDTPPFKYVKGGKYKSQRGQVFQLNEIETIEENDLIRIFKQSHDALWAGGELNPSQAFDELDKLIFCKIWDEKNTDKGQPYKFQIYKNESPDDLKLRIEELYNKGKLKDPEVFNKPIDLTAERFQTVVRYLQKINLTETDLDSKGRAFETFLGTYFRGEFGQYFTPRAVVKMMIDVLPMTNESKVLDTSCGSGGFLLYALDKVRQQADEKFDKNDVREAVQHFTHWHDFAEKKLFGIEINESIARVAKMNMIIHDDGHTNVIAFDGLHFIDYIGTKNQGFTPNSFDFIVTNPPFGSIVKQSEKSYMQVDGVTAPYYNFSLREVNWIDGAAKGKHLTTGRENQSTEVLFIEQCHKFLKEGAYLAVVIPDGILTNSSLQYVRDDIERNFRIVSVVSLPQTTFTHTGAGVKSSVMFLKKHTQTETDRIKNIQDDLKDRVAKERQLNETYKKWEAEKREALKPLLKLKTEESQAQKEAINEQFTEKWNNLFDEIAETYQQRKQAALPSYPILMAVAENIGYDATGKTITQNDLPEIATELKRFINSIEKGEAKANFC
jgi:type I restriction enzyme M protein